MLHGLQFVHVVDFSPDFLTLVFDEVAGAVSRRELTAIAAPSETLVISPASRIGAGLSCGLGLYPTKSG